MSNDDDDLLFYISAGCVNAGLGEASKPFVAFTRNNLNEN